MKIFVSTSGGSDSITSYVYTCTKSPGTKSLYTVLKVPVVVWLVGSLLASCSTDVVLNSQRDFNYGHFSKGGSQTVACGGALINLQQLLTLLRPRIIERIRNAGDAQTVDSLGINNAALTGFKLDGDRPIIRWVFQDYIDVRPAFNDYGVEVTVDVCREKILSTYVLAWG